jgi:hypothetical protein
MKQRRDAREDFRVANVKIWADAQFEINNRGWCRLGSDSGDKTQYVGPLDGDGSFEAPEVKEDTGGKKVHFYVTVLAPPNDSSCVTATTDPQPWPNDPPRTTNSWTSIFKCSANGGQKKEATISTCEKHEASVDTNPAGSKTTFSWTIKSNAPLNPDGTSPDAGVILLCTTKTTS